MARGRNGETDGLAPMTSNGERQLGDVPSPLNQGHVRQGNAWSVLSAVRAADVATRSRITADTGLTAMTVHRLVTDLRRRKLLVSAGRSSAGLGRPSFLYRFNASIGDVVGIDVGNETTRAVVADLCGDAKARRELPTAEIESDLAGGLVGLGEEILAEAKVTHDSLVGIGVGVPAVTDGDGTIRRASLHVQWAGLPLGARLRAAFDTEVVVRQDDHLAALAEHTHGGCVGSCCAVVLNVGKGIGVGLVADGSVYSGAHAAAGRVAWIPVPLDGASSTGLIGTMLTGDGLAAAYRALGGRSDGPGARPVFEADAAGDALAAAAIDGFARRLGWLVAALVAVLDPEVVVIGGGISRSFERLRGPLTEQLGEIVATPPPVVASQLVPEAVVTGAIDAALELADGWLRARIER